MFLEECSMKNFLFAIAVGCLVTGAGCSKNAEPTPTPQPTPFTLKAVSVNGATNATNSYTDLSGRPVIKLAFGAAIDHASATSAILLRDASGNAVSTGLTYEKSDSVVVVQPAAALPYLTAFKLIVATSLTSTNGGKLSNAAMIDLRTGIDSTAKYPTISDNELLDKVQRTTFKYFWDFGHPVSGLARERSNGDNEVVTSGGSGFGIMAIVAAVDRGFITHAEGLERMQKIVGFLKNTAQKFHGAFPHWLNGTTGNVMPFSEKDNGADLVETSFLMEGLLCARQYFSDPGTAETTLRTDINDIWHGVEWDWFRKSNEDVLYWHWSPNYAWDINMQIKGWNECLVTYALAAASPTHAIPKSVYDNGWASNGAMQNGKSFYNITLPLGPDYGGPLFFAHYAFMGIDPTGLKDAYADYWQQNQNHTLINYNYAVEDPKNYGYSNLMWGLTASDIPNGYTASSPTNDVGVIAPTAAISSMPYTPTQSMQALQFFYYTLGDKIWQDNSYGFVDAFSIKDLWYANSYLAIDQGPIMVMLENYRSGLLWDLFMSCPEVKTGMNALGFTSPHL